MLKSFNQVYKQTLLEKLPQSSVVKSRKVCLYKACLYNSYGQVVLYSLLQPIYNIWIRSTKLSQTYPKLTTNLHGSGIASALELAAVFHAYTTDRSL
ncbi:hypothetical protein VV11_003610 [Trichodesmium erythraeum 21-75]|nr:hypothetical protein [Trichodesmium erythraeum 21-75]